MKNQKGFTIVELLIGMTILSIVAVALTGFIVSSSKSYAAANTEILVQQESQLAMNQISDVIIDTTRSVNYVGFASDGTPEQAIKDADFTIDVEDKCLVLYNGEGTVALDEDGNPILDADGNPQIAEDETTGNPIITGGNGNKNYQIYWDKNDETLWFTEADVSETDFDPAKREVLAEYVKDFSVDLSQVEEKRVVKITISYGYNNRTYETSNNITIRNKVLVNSVNLMVDKTRELSIRPKQSVVYLEPGEDYYRFSTPVIDGRNIIDKSVTWEISSESTLSDPGDAHAGHTGFTDAANGIIYISSAEKTESFKVTVTTNAVDSAGEHASAEVLVYVKRANSVSLVKKDDSDKENGDYEISPGCTFTIPASIVGVKLGYTCSNCGDEVDIDKFVVKNENSYGWKLTDTNNICTMISSDNNKAEFSISSSAKPGQQITIEATSLLSTTSNALHRSYDRAFGTITLTVANHKKDITPDGDFKYGDEPLTLNWDYEGGTAVVCLRVKERGKEGEKVMIIKTDGKAIRVGADVLGLDLNSEYDISMQVLECDLEKAKQDGTFEKVKAELIASYTNPANIDSTGSYNGADYRASSMLTVPLERPQITITYNGKDYVGTEVNISPISALSVPSNVLEPGISCNITNISVTRGAAERVKNYAKANLYTGDGKELYYYDEPAVFNPDANNHIDTTGNGGIGALVFGDCSIRNASGLKVKLDRNKNAMDAVGSYYYIPMFAYENGTDAKRYEVIYKDYTPDYDWHYYYRPESKINFTIISGGNLKLWANTDVNNNRFVNGEIYFPTPSDSSFRDYFTLNNPVVQTVIPSNNNYFKILESNGSTDKGVTITRMTCQYISTEDSYVIELFYECKDTLWNRKVEKSAGKFKCSAKGTDWIQIGIGELDDQLNRGNTTVAGNGNATIIIKTDTGGLKAGTYDACIALPTDSEFTQTWWGGFGFDLNAIKNNNGQFVNATLPGGTTISYRNDENGVPTVKTLQCKSAKCKYDAATQTYTLEIECTNTNVWPNQDINLGSFTYKEGGTSWK